MTNNKMLKAMVAFVMMIILMFTSVVPTFAVSIGTQTYITTGESTGFSCTKDGFHYDFLYMKIRGSDNDYVYCAEPGAGWTETYYKVQAPKDDSYWKSLSKTKKEGMTLACMFGYPTQSAKTLGASTSKEAYAATQAIVWEYASGVRTKATGNPSNTAFRGALNKSALAAYNNILSQMNTYKNAPGYSAEEMFNHNKLYMMSTATGYPEQAIILYEGPVPEMFGAIEIYKKDQDGSPLAGAEFKIYDSNGVVKQVLTTNENGYAITKGGKLEPSLEYGKYIVEETKAPEGYKISGVNRWVVEVGKANNGVVTIEVVNELKKGYLIVEKFDEEDNPLEGAEFTVYDKEGKAVTVVGPTDEDGYAISEGGSTNPCIPYGTYTVKETKFPVGVEEKEVEWEFTLSDNHPNESKEIINKKIQWDLTLTKRVASGYTTTYPVVGAKYGLYKDGELIETLVIGENNKAHTKSYPTGTGYTIKEIEAPEGYRIDSTEYSLDEFTSVSYLSAQKDADGDGAYDIFKTVYDFPLGGCIYLRKKMQDKFDMSDFMASEEGAEFVIYNKRFSSYEAAVRFNAVSNYDSCVIDKTGTGIWQDGQRESRTLTFGTYIVHQTKAGKNGLILSEDFEVVIDREITYGFTCRNEWERYDVVIEKYDSETDKLIVNSDATFKIKDKETGEFITLVNADETVSLYEFTTNDGIIKLPVGLPQGEYELVETSAPEGYTADTPSISFSVNKNTVDDNNTLTIKVDNTPLKGTISVSKKGIVFTGTNTSESDFGTVYTPVFENKYLSGVTFDVIADEDIITADGTKHYSKNDVVQTLTTRADAPVKSKELPLGKYRVEETATLGGYKLDTTPRYVTVTNDGTNAVQNFTVKITNNRASSEIIAVKEAYQWKEISGVGDEVNRKVVTVPGVGFTFGLYADEKFTSYDGSSTIEKDSLIAVVVSDEEGKVRFGGNLPFGNYYVKELAAPANNYALSDMKYKISTATDKTDGETITVKVTDKPILNKFVYGEAKVKKVDSVTGNPVEGALIEVKSETGAVIRCGYTDKNGELSFLVEPGKYTAYEKEAPKGYLLNTEEYNFTVTENDIKENKVIEVKIENVPLRGKITIIKKAEQFVGYETTDSKYGTVFTPLFEVKPFAGATFSVTAAEDIYSPNGTLVYSKGDTVETLTTTNTGVVTTKELYPGKYNITETATQGGYKLDTTVYAVEVKNDGKQAVVDYSKTFINERADIDINAVKEAVVWKTIINGKEVTRVTEVVAGAGFTFGLYADEDLTAYDGSSTIAKDSLVATLISDKDGKVNFSGNLPFGNYYIKELEAPEEHYIIPDTKYPVSAKTDKTDGNTITVNVTDEPILNTFAYGKAKIKKVDDVTGNPVEGALIEVKSDTDAVVHCGYTDKNGELSFSVEPGNYTAYEKEAPNGYLLNTKKYDFTVTAQDIESENTVEVEIENVPLRGKITVIKKAEQFVGYETTDSKYGTVTTPLFEVKPFAGATFTVTAAEDIYSPDGTLMYSKDDTVETLTTTNTGVVTTKELYPGKYNITETATQGGYKLDSTVYAVEVKNDGKQAVTEITKLFINEKADVEINAVKEAVVWKSIGEGERVTRITEIVPGAGFTFGLYTSEDITTYDGSKELKKDSLVDVVRSDNKGNIKFRAEIPFGNYYVKELEAPEEHYIIPDTKYPVSAQTDKTDGATIVIEATEGTILNDFIKHPVKITKTDLVTGEPVKGATVEIFDVDGNVIYREITGADGTLPNVVLEPGKYTFRETLAPLGYICNPGEFEFTVNADGTVDGTVDFTNEPAKITVTKTDAVHHKPIPGTEITFYTASGDEVGPSLCTYTTDEDGQVTAMYLEVGQKYYFKETKAANGFAINKNLYTFVINEDGTITGDTSLEDDYTRFTINKINDKGEPLANVVFTMYDENGDPVDTATSDEAGIAQFVGFGVGKYTIKETATVKGYELAPDSIKIENNGSWDNDSELCSISVINNKIVLPPVIKTGDDTNITPWIAAVSISGTIILAAVIIQLAKRKKTSTH